MKPQKPMPETLRYKNYVANLRHKQPYAKEAALLKEIAGGVQWRMDAAIDALTAPAAKGKFADRAYVNRHNIMKQAAMFGRLQTTEKLAKAFSFTEEGNRHADGAVIAAFQVAVLHGHYKVADFLHAKCGAQPDYDSGDHTPPAMGWALREGNLKKISYLVDKGADPSYALVSAVSGEKHSKAVIDLLIAKGADVNAAAQGFFTPFLQAVKYRRFDLAEHLLDKGADPAKSGGEVMLNLIEAKNDKLLEKVIARGAKPDTDLLQRALYAGNLAAAEIMMKSGSIDINAQGGAALLTAIRVKEQPEAVMFCMMHGADPAVAYRTATQPKQSWEKRGDEEKVQEYLLRLIQQPPAAPAAAAPKTPKPPQP
ncbi:MAG: hypothetical protein Q8K65_01330 [Alphaproteobacteria bacterium]|nr:hypothetical protein [Alphaproteobacteria bacterium]